jgi:hypothetical protein
MLLKGQCQEIVSQLRLLVNSLGLNNILCIPFTLFKLHIKSLRRFKQGDSQVAGAGFHLIAKLRTEIIYPVLAYHGVYSADYHNKNGHTSDCQSQESDFES